MLFLYASLASLAGSIQIGPVNSRVIEEALVSKRQAYPVALGGSIPQALYALISYFIVTSLKLSDVQTTGLMVAGSIVIILFGIGFIFKKNTITASTERSSLDGFSLGFLRALSNLQLLVFWTMVLGYMLIENPQFALATPFNLISLALGSMLGTAVMLMFFVWITDHFKIGILKYLTHSYGKVVGSLLCVLGLIQLIIALAR